MGKNLTDALIKGIDLALSGLESRCVQCGRPIKSYEIDRLEDNCMECFQEHHTHCSDCGIKLDDMPENFSDIKNNRDYLHPTMCTDCVWEYRSEVM